MDVKEDKKQKQKMHTIFPRRHIWLQYEVTKM